MYYYYYHYYIIIICYEETSLQDFLVILKPMLQNYKKTFKKYVLGTTCTVSISKYSKYSTTHWCFIRRGLLEYHISSMVVDWDIDSFYHDFEFNPVLIPHY